MFQYLIIQLDDTSTSYCHYSNEKTVHRLIDFDDLKAGILFAMKENLTIQFAYPDYELPQKYKDAIHSIDHSDIVSSSCKDINLKENADVIILNNWTETEQYDFKDNTVCVLRTTKVDLLDKYRLLIPILSNITRLNIVVTDIDAFTEQDFEDYKKMLASLSEEIEKLYIKGKLPQLNLLTDRMILDKMNNCNAGWENITLAPDGKFYVCPAFYLANNDEEFGLGKTKYSIGDLKVGLDIKNPQLYQLSHAPLCCICDAYQCKRCVWLNRKTTYELNTPSHEQCVIAHLERNASRELLNNIRKHGAFLPEREEIKEITYLDPFEISEQ